MVRGCVYAIEARYNSTHACMQTHILYVQAHMHHTIYCIHLLPPIYPDELAEIRQQAQQIAKTMNLSVVRLCFQAFILDEHGRFTVPVDPVFSHKVYDSSEYSVCVCVVCVSVCVVCVCVLIVCEWRVSE